MQPMPHFRTTPADGAPVDIYYERSGPPGQDPVLLIMGLGMTLDAWDLTAREILANDIIPTFIGLVGSVASAIAGAASWLASTVAGIVNAGNKPWGAVLRVDREGRLTSVGRGVPDGLWVLERSPDGTLWAGGRGAYRLQGGEWVSAWSVPE